MPPTLANGKICYIEIPATNIERSAEFYGKVFGWNIRKRDNGSTAFDDSTGQVSGSWVLGRPPATKPGVLFYVMMDNVAATIDDIIANGGEIVQPIGADAPEITARFRDPGGNVIGLYQQPALKDFGPEGVRMARRRLKQNEDAVFIPRPQADFVIVIFPPYGK